MTSSSLTHPVMKEDGECINWAELPYELTSSILGRLDSIDIMENAQKVCTSWRTVSKDPSMWRKIDMRNSGDLGLNLEIMCRHAVDRSQGGLLEIDIWHFGTDSLLNYIADCSSNLRSLKLAKCSLVTSEGLTEAIVKLPLLEELDTIDILNNAQKVCRSWRRVCKDPAMWRKIDMRNSDDIGYEVHIIMIVMRKSGDLNLEVMWRYAVDLSQGGLVEIDFGYIGTDSLLNYVAHSSSNLRSLKFAFMPTITIEGLTEALGKLPLLEEFEVSHFTLLGDSLKVVGQSCPKLKTLKLHRCGMGPPRDVSDDDALAIAETMHGLSFLQLVGNCLTHAGLNAILDNCPYLEHLDIRLCLNLTNLVGDLEKRSILDNCSYLEHLDLRLCLNLTNLVGDLEKRCSERIKVLRRPFDSTHDYPYDVYFYEDDPFEDDYPEDYDI